MPLKKFKIEKIIKNHNHCLLYINTHDLEIKENDLRIYNLQPFHLAINEQLEICNNTDSVKVSIDNFSKRTIQIRYIRVQELTKYFNFQFEIEQFIKNNKSKLKPTDPKLAAYLQEIEVALLLDGLLAMNRETAIDMALDKKDKLTFNKIMNSIDSE